MSGLPAPSGADPRRTCGRAFRTGSSSVRAHEAVGMPEETAKVELNARVFVRGDELAASLVAAHVVYRCLSCDAAGFAYHLDPHHTIQQLLASGAREWWPPDAPAELAHRRIPALFVHHLAWAAERTHDRADPCGDSRAQALSRAAPASRPIAMGGLRVEARCHAGSCEPDQPAETSRGEHGPGTFGGGWRPGTGCSPDSQPTGAWMTGARGRPCFLRCRRRSRARCDAAPPAGFRPGGSTRPRPGRRAG